MKTETIKELKIRVSQLKPGDSFFMLGKEYVVMKIKNERIYYRPESSTSSNGSFGINSKEFVLKVE